ncbi:MAG: hypothetical protein RL100_850 [Actinomycetota bacterium]|jgi:DNA-binding GntR family transcriptional regulator
MSLHEAILNGKLPAGARLKVRDIADQVGTSVMPVREAIRRLEEAGLAERKPHKGAVVTDLTVDELTHIYDVRMVLEREATAAGVPNLTDKECDRMEVALDGIRKAIKNREIIPYLNQDEKFLEIMYGASGNPVLVNLIKSLWMRCRAYKIVGAKRSFDLRAPEELLVHQEAMLAAARAKNATKAAAANEKALREASARIEATLNAKKAAE